MEFSFSILHAELSRALSIFFSFSVPFVGLATSLLALAILYLPKQHNREQTTFHLLIYLLKWQYLVSFAYSLNMIFNDDEIMLNIFTNNILSLRSTRFVCKFRLVLMRFLYCLAPWLQVVSKTFFTF